CGRINRPATVDVRTWKPITDVREFRRRKVHLCNQRAILRNEPWRPDVEDFCRKLPGGGKHQPACMHLWSPGSHGNENLVASALLQQSRQVFTKFDQDGAVVGRIEQRQVDGLYPSRRRDLAEALGGVGSNFLGVRRGEEDDFVERSGGCERQNGPRTVFLS